MNTTTSVFLSRDASQDDAVTAAGIYRETPYEYPVTAEAASHVFVCGASVVVYPASDATAGDSLEDTESALGALTPVI